MRSPRTSRATSGDRERLSPLHQQRFTVFHWQVEYSTSLAMVLAFGVSTRVILRRGMLRAAFAARGFCQFTLAA